jgi:hypothetical protein
LEEKINETVFRFFEEHAAFGEVAIDSHLIKESNNNNNNNDDDSNIIRVTGR